MPPGDRYPGAEPAEQVGVLALPGCCEAGFRVSNIADVSCCEAGFRLSNIADVRAFTTQTSQAACKNFVLKLQAIDTLALNLQNKWVFLPCLASAKEGMQFKSPAE